MYSISEATLVPGKGYVSLRVKSICEDLLKVRALIVRRKDDLLILTMPTLAKSPFFPSSYSKYELKRIEGKAIRGNKESRLTA